MFKSVPAIEEIVFPSILILSTNALPVTCKLPTTRASSK